MEESVRSIAVLYIATGPYIAFWDRFYESFEQYFLKNMEVHYYVFTDKENFPYLENPRVHKVDQKAEPWPLPTLLKFHRFLEIKDELLKYDYLYQSNANVICVKEVKETDFLPRKERGESLMFTRHPGYLETTPKRFPYDRNPASKAYVPYNCGNVYVYGAMNGGESKEYLQFIEKLDKQIIEDLKKGTIAKWHDESHINHDIICMSNYRILPTAFCYPVGFSIPGECIIKGVEKKTVFDVEGYKGNYREDTEKARCPILSKMLNKVKYIYEKEKPGIYMVRDFLLRKKIAE